MKSFFLLFIALFATVASYSQTTQSKTDTSQTPTAKQAKYTCEMHLEVTSDKPGKCPKCGMELTKAKVYSCPMHPEVVSNKPGKCPKCQMDLTEVKPKARKE